MLDFGLLSECYSTQAEKSSNRVLGFYGASGQRTLFENTVIAPSPEHVVWSHAWGRLDGPGS